MPGHVLFDWRLKDVSAAVRPGSITHKASEKDTHCSHNDTFKSGRGYLSARRSEEQSARTWRPFILPNHLLWGECSEISARMTAKRPGPLASCVVLNAQKQINYSLFLRRTDNVHSNTHGTHVCVNVCIMAGGLPADVCGEDVSADANNLPELWHRCGSSSREELTTINNWISPGWVFFSIHYLSSNWLPRAGFLTCPAINVLLLCAKLMATAAPWKTHTQLHPELKKPRQFVLYRFAGDGAATLISRNGIQQDRLSLPDKIGLFFILLSRCLWGNRAAQVFLLTQNSLWINLAVNNLCCSAPACLFPRLRPPRLLFVTPCCCFLECGTSYSMRRASRIWWRVIVLYTNNTCAGTQTKMYKLALAHAFISPAHVWRGCGPYQFRGVLFWIKCCYGRTLFAFTMSCWQFEPLCVCLGV